VIPFAVRFKAGIPLYEQVVYAAKKAIISGQIRVGDAFPSVRALSKELKINPNTAHKVISNLVSAGLLETRPGLGTVVAEVPAATPGERIDLLDNDIEELVVNAKKLGIAVDDVTSAVATHWKRLGGDGGGRTKR
jgi:GntR family transcriptional regulator